MSLGREPTPPAPRPAVVLGPEERKEFPDLMHSGRFIDQAPREVHAVLIDEGRYLCPVRTMYRVLEEGSEVTERRNQLKHPVYQKPELPAAAPNEATCRKQGIEAGRLTIHADRSSSMTSKPGAFPLADPGVAKTHSRPHTSHDNPFSESRFKTLKYRPDFPERFGGIEETRFFCQSSFAWYNQEHYQTGIGLLAPHGVH